MYGKAALLSCVLLCVHSAWGAIVPVSLILDPSGTVVHYVKGYLHAPADINLSGMRFITVDIESSNSGDDDDDDDGSGGDGNDEDTNVPTQGEPATEEPMPTPAPSDADAGDSGQVDITESPTPNPTLAPTTAEGGANDSTETPTEAPTDGTATTETPTGGAVDVTESPTGGTVDVTESPTGGAVDVTDSPTATPIDGTADATEPPTATPTDGDGNRLLQEKIEARRDSVMDFALFKLPEWCASSTDGCDWADLGVGVHDNKQDGGISYCCSQDTFDRGFCKRSEKGRLLIDTKKGDIDVRTLSFPADGEVVQSLKGDDAIFKIPDDDGTYILVMANCNDLGREILAAGKMEWKQERGLLPGDLYGLMQFYMILALIYLATLILYSLGMKLYQDATIPIQKYIVTTMALGLAELSFRAFDLYVWDQRGTRIVALLYPAIVVGVLKRGISRCLLVMVAMGWGIVRDSLGPALYQITLLGLIYVGASGFRDLFAVVAATEVHSITTSEEDELFGLVFLLDVCIFVINVIFFIWIICNLKSTAQYLDNMNQSTKLKNHKRLTVVMWISMIFAVGYFALKVVDFVFDVLTQDQEWILEALVHGTYVFTLISVAVLWRPNPNAKDYAYVMELNMEDDDENGGNELELSATVPSASDDLDGNDPDHSNGIKADDGRFT